MNFMKCKNCGGDTFNDVHSGDYMLIATCIFCETTQTLYEE